MPSAWVHAVIDIVAYGRAYFDLHKEKDEPYRTLRWRHREIRHEWYQAFGEKWTFNHPFPTFLRDQILKTSETSGASEAEKHMAYVDHDYIDRTWDDLSDPERKYWEGFFAYVLFSPKILKEWAGVDVLEGRIQRVINGREVWENCPELKCEYERLLNYVKAFKKE